MRKFILGVVAAALTVGLTIAGEVAFVKYDATAKDLTVKEDGKDVVYKVTDDTKFKRGDKDIPSEKGITFLSEKAKDGAKFELTAGSDKKVTEIKLKGKK